MTRQLLIALLLLLGLSGPSVGQDTQVLDTEIRVVDAPQDEAIEQRLTQVLGAIDGLDAVAIEVNAGVVTLSGDVSTARAARDIGEIASRVEGVIYVQNRLDDDVNIAARVQPLTRRFKEMSANAMQAMPVALVALAIVFIFALIGRWAGNHDGWLRRLGLSELAANLGKRVVRLVLTGMGVLIALEVMDATALVGAVLGIAGVAGIAIGFAFRNIVENYLAGVLLSARNPFAIGDQVEVGTFTGKVMRLTSRDTVLMTRDGNHLRIPNSVIITSAMTNFSRNPLRRFEFNINVPDAADLNHTRELGIAALHAMPGILNQPAPQGLISEISDGNAAMRFLAWIDQRDTDFAKARSEAIRVLKMTLDQAGVVMPQALYHVVLQSDTEAVPTTPDASNPVTPLPIAARETADTSADLSIDQQMAEELSRSDEENLLSK